MKTNTVRVLIIILGLVIMVIGLVKYKEHVKKTADRTENPIFYEDLKVLDDPTASSQRMWAALIRLGERRNPKALAEAKKRLSDKDEWIRAGAVECLGYYPEDTESLKLIVKSYEDPSEKVKEAVFKALSHNKTAEALEVINKLLQESKLDASQKTQGLSSLVKVSQDPKQKEIAIQGLLKIAMSGPEKDQLKALQEVSGFDPSNKELLDYLQTLVPQTGKPELAGFAIRHLAAMRPDYLKDKMLGLHKSPVFLIRLSTVQTVFVACPPDRWSILREVLESEKDQLIWTEAARMPVLMPSPEAQNFLEKVRKMPGLKEGQIKVIDDSIVKVAKSKMVDPCTIKRKSN